MIDTAANLATYDIPDRVLCPCHCGRLILIWEWERWTGRKYDPRPLMPRNFWVKP